MRQSCNNLIVVNLLALACLPVGGGAQNTIKTRIPSEAKGGVTGSRVGASVSKLATGATVMVRAAAQVTGKTFTLGEIADIKGGDAELRKRLAGVAIGTAPLPGLSRQLLPGDVIVHLRAAQCGELLDSKRITLITPPSMQINRTGQDVSPDEISRAALAAAQQAISNLTGATLESEMPAGKVILPLGKLILLPGVCQGAPEQGALHVPVSLIVDDKTVQTVNVTLKVHRKLTALVARHTIEPHDMITA